MAGPTNSASTPSSKAPASPKKKPPTKHAPGTSQQRPKSPTKTTKKEAPIVKKKKVPANTTKSGKISNSPPPPAAAAASTKYSNRRRDDDRRKRGILCFAIFCCFLFLLAIGLILGLVVFKKDNDDSNPSSSNGGSTGSGGNPNIPTQAPVPLPPSVVFPVPTRAPTPPVEPVPTTSLPTAAPVVLPTSLLSPTSSTLIIVPFADTLVYRDGFYRDEAFGEEDTFLVQNGPDSVNEIPDAVGLIAFDLSNVPSSASKVTLQLYHQAATRDRGAATITIRRMPATPLAIETLHGGFFDPDLDDGILGPSFQVSPSDDIVQVDLTSLALPVDPNDDDSVQLFLMLENVGEVQVAGATGDRFYTRESLDPPQLIVTI